MKLAVDIFYSGKQAYVAGVSFSSWQDSSPLNIYSCRVSDVAEYVPGQFYKRELPCILTLLDQFKIEAAYIMVDGYVYLGDHEQPGLGKHLYDALNEKVKVIGVAKKPYLTPDPESEVHRGESKIPLYVTSVGVHPEEAKSIVKQMHGPYRIPTLLKKVDQVSRTGQQ